MSRNEVMILTQVHYIIQSLTDKGILFETGLTEDEITRLESRFSFRFPPDLKLFLQTALPVSEGFVNWREGLRSKQYEDEIISKLTWPLEGMLFDIRSNNFWPESWGVKPGEGAEIIAKGHYESYPQLIPIYSHRHIPNSPNDSGNPVFSVYQMDIIYYGYDLAAYFANEFHFELPEADFEIPASPKVAIEFWSEQAG